MIANFRFKLTLLGVERLASPLNTAGVKIKSEKEGANVFFRTKLSGSLRFIETDYDALNSLEQSSERCADVFFTVERYCGGVYTPFWQGVFSLNEVKWNHSRCEAVVQPRPNDAYRKIIDFYTKEFNVLDLPATDAVTAKIDLNEQFEFISTSNEGAIADNEDADTWLLFLKMNYWIDGNLTNKGRRNETCVWFRTVTTRPFFNGIAPELNGWTLINENQSTKVAKYAKKPAIYNFTAYQYGSKGAFNHYQDLKQINCGAPFDGANWILIPECLNIREKIVDDRPRQLIWRFGAFTFNRNRRLLDVLSFLVGKVSPDVAPVASEFFTDPVNYATGMPNKVRNLLIAQKSDIISSRSSEAAKKGMLSLKNILDDLRMMFNVYWFLDAEGKIRLEHISYFESIGSEDFTVPKYAKHLEGKNAYEYQTDKMPRFEKLIFSDAANEDFQEGLIEYASSCVNYQEGQDTSEQTVSRISTDIENIIVSGDEGSREGFVLISHDGSGNIYSESGDITGVSRINGHLSAANLMRNYWLHNRVLISGLLNGRATNFRSVIKTKKQDSFSVPLCCALEINPFFKYITNVGSNGSLLTSEIDFKTQQVTLEIIHETGGSGLAQIARQFDDSFDDSFL